MVRGLVLLSFLALLELSPASSKLDASKLVESDPPQPVARLGDQPLSAPISETHEVGGRKIPLRLLSDELQLTYVHGLLSAEELTELVAMADARDGWVRSPLKAQTDGECLEKDSRRTSSSCPMLWPLVYARPELQERVAERPEMAAELSLCASISERVAQLLSAAGLSVSSQHIEPLQLIKYAPGERFGAHHDYHATGESSVQGEQRQLTVLVFGSTLLPGEGGETHFPKLGLSVWPRTGDAIAWMNVNMEGEPEEKSLHEGRPPLEKQKIAINVWVSDVPFSVDGGLEKAVRTGAE